MSEQIGTLASAVVLPGPDAGILNGSAKRRRSSASSTDSKRPRLDTIQQPKPNDRPSTVTPTTGVESPSPGSPQPDRPVADTARRRSSAKPGADEERKRGKRLFGGLLGTLSQKDSTRTQKRKEEIEKKQQAKLRQQEEERESERRLRAEDLERKRWQEQRAWAERSTQVRQDNKNAMAHFLVTLAEPKLYFLPFERTPQQLARIADQIAAVEKEISDDLPRVDTTGANGDAEPTTIQQKGDGVEGRNDEQTYPVDNNNPDRTDATPAEADADMNNTEHPETATPNGGAAENTEADADSGATETEAGRDAAEDNEEMVEAGEDTVMY